MISWYFASWLTSLTMHLITSYFFFLILNFHLIVYLFIFLISCFTFFFPFYFLFGFGFSSCHNQAVRCISLLGRILAFFMFLILIFLSFWCFLYFLLVTIVTALISNAGISQITSCRLRFVYIFVVWYIFILLTFFFEMIV